MKTLCIDNNHEVLNNKGGRIVIDKEFNRKIYISPPSKFNIHYVMIKHNSLDKSSERFAIDSQGNILAHFNTPDSIKIFNERYNKLLVK